MESGKKDKGEIIIEVVIKQFLLRNTVMLGILSLMHAYPLLGFLDLSKCIPHNIHEVYKLIGISSAYQLIIQRLSVALEMVGKNIFKEHLLLVSDCITYWNIIGFNPVGDQDLITLWIFLYRLQKVP